MIRNIRQAMKSLTDLKVTQINHLNRHFLLSNNRACLNLTFVRSKNDNKKKDGSHSSLFIPVPIKPSTDGINVGVELTGAAIDKAEILKILSIFSQKREIRLLCMENGLDRE